MKPLVLALQFMTRLPLPAITADEETFAAAIRWFPAAGLVVGLTVAGAALAGMARGVPMAALLALVGWVAITGALHLDGLGDVADAAGAGHGDRARIGAVLADPHIGAFGVVAIVLQLLAKFAALQLVLAGHAPWVLVAIPVIARIAPIGWTLALPPLHTGMASRFAGGARGWVLATWGGPALACAAWWCPALLIAVPAAMAWGWWLRARIGGISGDGHGAGIELVETAMLLGVGWLS